MLDNIDDIATFYNSDPEREHARLAERQLEYELTWRYLEHYLPTQGSILEIGAAQKSGRQVRYYPHELSR